MKRIFTITFIISLFCIIIPSAVLFAQTKPMEIVETKEIPIEYSTGEIINHPIKSKQTKSAINQRVQRVQTADFIVDYSGFTPEAQAAFQRAVDVWANLIFSEIPIRIAANWLPLTSPQALGGAIPSSFALNFPAAPQQDVLYPISLAEKITGQALNASESR